MPSPVAREIAGPAGPLVVWDWPGRGPSTLLLHGVGNYGRYWDDVARAIDGRLRLLAPDARGHGDSARPDDGYAPGDFVADALAILDASNVDRAVVVGHSMGGYHSLHLATAHPERVSALAVVDTGPQILPEGSERARRLSLGRPETFSDLGEAEEYLRRTSPGYSDHVYRDRLRWLFHIGPDGIVWRSSAHALRRIFAGSRDPHDAWAAARGLEMPVLVVRGTRSPVLAAETARRMAEEIPDARLLELDAAHNVPLDRPGALAQAIVELAARGSISDAARGRGAS